MLEIIYQSVVAVIHFSVCVCARMFGGAGTVVSPRDDSRTNKPFNIIGQSLEAGVERQQELSQKLLP